MPFALDLETILSVTLLLTLLFTGMAILLALRARLALLLLFAQYLVLTLFLAQIVSPAVAIVRLLSGGLVTLVLLITARQIGERESKTSLRPPPAPGAAFRFLAAVFVAICLAAVTASTSFFGLPAPVLFGSLWLIAVGLLIAILTRESLRFGMGLLVFTAGFGLLETAIEGSLFLYGLLNIADLMIALLIAHLATLPPEVEGGRRRGEAA